MRPRFDGEQRDAFVVCGTTVTAYERGDLCCCQLKLLDQDQMIK